MAATDPADTLSRRQFRHAWLIVTIAGALGSTYMQLIVKGVPKTKFLTELGAGADVFGLMAAITSFSLALQIAGGIVSNRIARRKPLWMVLTVAQRLMPVAVLVAPWLITGQHVRMVWIIVVFAAHDLLGNFGVPMWMSWMSDILPKRSLNRSWATRQRIIMATNIVLLVLVALVFDQFEQADLVLFGYLAVGTFGVFLGVLDILLFIWVPEPENEKHEVERTLREAVSGTVRDLLEPLRDRSYRPFLAFRAYWQLAASIAWPFFDVFMIQHLQFSVLSAQIVMLMGPLGILAGSRLSGLLCDTYGFRPVIRMSVLLKAVVPFMFFIAPPADFHPIRFMDHVVPISMPFLSLMLFLDGCVNSALLLAMQGVVLKNTPRKNRSMYIAATNCFAMGVPGAIGPFIAGMGAEFLNARDPLMVGAFAFTGFHAVFLTSSLMRVGANFFASRIHEPESQSIRTILSHLLRANPMKATRMIYRLQEAEKESDKQRCIRRLGELGSPLAIHEIIPFLRDPSRNVRKASAEALGRIGMSEATQPLAEALFDPESGIQSPAARALGAIGDFKSLQSLLHALNRLKRDDLFDTVDSLAKIGDSAAILPLICLFDEAEDDNALRRHIAAALERLTDMGSMEETLEVLAAGRPYRSGLQRM